MDINNSVILLAGLQSVFHGGNAVLDVLLLKGHDGLQDHNGAVSQGVVHALLGPAENTDG